jgi:hypothetical protein
MADHVWTAAELRAIAAEIERHEEPATEEDQKAILAKLADIITSLAPGATEATLQAILQKLSADPATETTLAAILAKLIAAPATEAKQDVLGGKLDAINLAQAALASETTLAAILAKLIEAPATLAGGIVSLLSAIAATASEVTAAAILAKLEAGIDATLTGGKAQQAVVIDVDADIAPTSAITANADTDATVIFANDDEGVAVKLISGVVYPYSIKKVTAGTGIVGLY